jgi:hypothetical protein
VVIKLNRHDKGMAPVFKQLASKCSQLHSSVGKPFLVLLLSVSAALCLQVLGRGIRGGTSLCRHLFQRVDTQTVRT